MVASLPTATGAVGGGGGIFNVITEALRQQSCAFLRIVESLQHPCFHLVTVQLKLKNRWLCHCCYVVKRSCLSNIETYRVCLRES